MIKKITVCFLVMAIAVGCSQAPGKSEKPVDPPVVEQPQKPVEQEKPEEEMKVKKIDESKDWVYVSKEDIFDFDSEMEFINTKNSKDFLSIWLEERNPEIKSHQLLKVNIESDSVEKLNQAFQERFDNQLYVYDQFLIVENEKVISILNKRGDVFFFSEFDNFNIDLITGTVINNSELLSKYDLTAVKVQSVISTYLDSNNLKACINGVIEDNYKCYLDSAINDGKGMAAKYSEQSILGVENEKLFILFKIMDASLPGNHIEIVKLNLN